MGGTSSTIDFYEQLPKGARLTHSVSGYNINVQTSAVINHISVCGFLVILGFWYFSTLITKDLLVFFLDKKTKENINSQGDADLDVNKHFKVN